MTTLFLNKEINITISLLCNRFDKSSQVCCGIIIIYDKVVTDLKAYDYFINVSKYTVAK